MFENILGSQWDRQTMQLGYHVFTRKETIERYSNAINYGNLICSVCGDILGEKQDDGWIKGLTPLSLHHICRVPPITIILHKKCHKRVEKSKNNLFNNMKPQFTRTEVGIAQDVIKYLVERKYKNYNGSHWVRYR